MTPSPHELPVKGFYAENRVVPFAKKRTNNIFFLKKAIERLVRRLLPQL